MRKLITKTGDDLEVVTVHYEWDDDYALIRKVMWNGIDVRPVLAATQVEALATECEADYYGAKVDAWSLGYDRGEEIARQREFA